MKLAFELVNSVKQISFLKEGDHHSIHRRSEQNKRQIQEGISSFSTFFCSLLELEHLASSFPALRLRFVPSDPLVPIPWTWFELHPWLFQVSSLRRQIMGLLRLHVCVNQVLLINPSPPHPNGFVSLIQ